MRPRWLWLGASLVLAADLIACGPVRAQSAPRNDGPLLGATVEGLRAAGRQLSPALRAAALDTSAASAKAGGADALDDPTITDNYTYYKDPGVFSAHTIMVTQSFRSGASAACAGKRRLPMSMPHEAANKPRAIRSTRKSRSPMRNIT